VDLPAPPLELAKEMVGMVSEAWIVVVELMTVGRQSVN
jgi:hypothetical protein